MCTIYAYITFIHQNRHVLFMLIRSTCISCKLPSDDLFYLLSGREFRVWWISFNWGPVRQKVFIIIKTKANQWQSISNSIPLCHKIMFSLQSKPFMVEPILFLVFAQVQNRYLHSVDLRVNNLLIKKKHKSKFKLTIRLSLQYQTRFLIENGIFRLFDLVECLQGIGLHCNRNNCVKAFNMKSQHSLNCKTVLTSGKQTFSVHIFLRQCKF